MKADLRSFSFEELNDLVIGLGFEGYRSTQLFSWMHKKMVQSLSEMGNIPRRLKEEISERADIYGTEIERCQESAYDGTRKYLIRLDDGNLIESVFMRYEHGNSICVSSQAGCRMGCSFCASTIGGLSRNLTAGEILGQIYSVSRDTGERISNVVIMGSGEPLDNYENVCRFIRLLNDERGLNISERNITLSTCGLVPMIEKLKGENFNITLAISLHAASDEKRRAIMPIAEKYSLDELMGACRDYYEGKKRRITFEYSLIAGFNDSKRDAGGLAGLLKGMNAHVNLIPVNPVTERSYKRPDRSHVEAFQNLLEKNHINVTIRRELGQDIDGACGQLRRRYQQLSV